MTVLITGANGFIGWSLCEKLLRDAVSVRGAVRSIGQLTPGVECCAVGKISSETDWSAALKDAQHVVHLAARVHVMRDKCADPLAEFRRVNVGGTASLAKQAADAGVRRFIFVSSIKVNGESTDLRHPFTAADTPAPQDPYGISKYEAEQSLRQIAAETGMEVVIIRPPLVYGPGVKANFESMMRWLERGVPLPFGAITSNRRSFVAVENLIDLIATCLTHPAAANQTFLVSDGEDLSTADLLKRMGSALGKPARLFNVPISVLHKGAVLLNRPAIYQRLCASLQVDIEKTLKLLDWTPPLSVDEGLRRAAKGF